MKKRIVCLLTATFMAFTIFAVPVAGASANATEENTTITDGNDSSAGLDESEESTDPINPEDPTSPDVPTGPETPTEPQKPTEPVKPTEPQKPTKPAAPQTPAKPVSIKGATVTTSQEAYGFTKAKVMPKVTVILNGKTLKNGRDYNVTYSNNIYPGTAKITVKGINKYKGTITKKFEIATVKGLKWIKSTPKSITFRWNARKNVTGYKVQRYHFAKQKWILVKTVKGTQTTLKNLIPGTGYKVRIVAYYKEGSKVYNAPVSTVLSMPTKPNKINLKKIENHPALYAQVSWYKRNSSGYQIRYSQNPSFKNAKTVKVIYPKQLTKKVKDLKNNKKYYIKVRAYKTYGKKTSYGQWSKTKSFVTKGTRWYNKNGKKYYYKNGKQVKGKMMFGKHQYFFNYQDGAWSGASAKMWREVKDSSSKTKYLIAVSRELNRLCVYEGKKGNWKLKYYWMCSTGRPENGRISKTPTGSWLMPKEDNHLGYIGGHKDYTCWYATRFYKRCFFHSVTYLPASKVNKLDPRLGMNISDGCIRMDIENAKWIYDNCHTGTRVIVY